MNIEIRKYNNNNIPEMTKIWNDIIDEGTSFPWDEHFSPEKVQYVLSQQTATYCAYADNELVGYYLLHPNSSGRCKHVANGLYAVEKEFRGIGIGTKLIIHSLHEAKKHGFTAMQYNSVVAINPSMSIYKKIGFEQVGIIKNGYKLINGNYSDLVIFYMLLQDFE